MEYSFSNQGGDDVSLSRNLRAYFGRSSHFLLSSLYIAQSAQPSVPQKIIIDTDIGDDVDDAFAVALALSSPELQILRHFDDLWKILRRGLNSWIGSWARLDVRTFQSPWAFRPTPAISSRSVAMRRADTSLRLSSPSSGL